MTQAVLSTSEHEDNLLIDYDIDYIKWIINSGATNYMVGNKNVIKDGIDSIDSNSFS